MPNFPTPSQNSRIGFHYFPDLNHYRESDLQAWLPELRTLGASWLTLHAPTSRTIPESFVRGLAANQVEPILSFPLSLENPPNSHDLGLLFNMYARWGAHYVALFDRPNSRLSWPAVAWAQSDLVERFLDRFVPLAEVALRNGLTPVFPALEPGGDYWDTTFLRAALQSLERRNQNRLLDNLVIGAYARAGNRPLNWGAGGPERWPNARPYGKALPGEDQRGFRIFDWYLTISQAVLGKTCPIILFGAGSHPHEREDAKAFSLENAAHPKRNLTIAQRLLKVATPAPSDDPLETIPDQVIAGNFWLLAAASGSRYADQAWFQPDGSTNPSAQALRDWLSGTSQAAKNAVKGAGTTFVDPLSLRLPISHYLLLPTFDSGISDWHLEVIRPYVKKYRPTVGFSTDEAQQARRVTVVGGADAFPEDLLNRMRAGGAVVHRISGDGTSIATQLAML